MRYEMMNSKDLCQKLGISERTLTTWRTKISQISGHKFKMEANPRGYSHYRYTYEDLEKFQKLSKEIEKTGDIDKAVRIIFGDRYKEMIEELIDFVEMDIDRLKEKLESLRERYEQQSQLYSQDNRRLEQRIEKLEKAFEAEQGKGALERLGLKKSRTD